MAELFHFHNLNYGLLSLAFFTSIIIVLILFDLLEYLYYMKYITFIFLLISSFFIFSHSVSANLSYNGGEYTNLCGSGLSANNHACSGSCNPTTGTCSNSGNTVVRFVCDGRLNECNQNESSFSSSQSLNNPGSNKTVAIVVFNKTCRQNGGWLCTDSDMKDYMVWYTGTSVNGTSTQAPTTTTTSAGSCSDQQIVLIQFQKPGASSWQGGSSFTNQNLQKGQQINVNCFAKTGSALLAGGYIDMTDPNGQTRRVSDTSELRNYSVDLSGTYSFTCRSATINDCTSSDSFVVQGSNPPVQTNPPVQSQPPAAMPQPAPQRSSCENLEIAGGNNSLVPATVTLRARGYDNKGNIQRYRFFFGDGQQVESDQPEVSHQYNVSGNFVARADVKDTQGNWKTSSSCETTVTVQSAPVESYKYGCSNVYITADNNSRAPSKVTFEVTGYDNKGNLQAYNLDFGNGITKESTGRSFEQIYTSAGTYVINAYVKNSQGNWIGDDASCRRTVTIGSNTPLTSQPSTGTPTFIPVAGAMSGILGLSVQVLKKKFASKL